MKSSNNSLIRSRVITPDRFTKTDGKHDRIEESPIININSNNKDEKFK